MDFLIDGSQKLKRHFSQNQNNDIYLCGNTLYILLPRRYTSGTSLRLQVGGRTSDGDDRQLIWTPMSETIVFGRSIAAGYVHAHQKSACCHHGTDDGCDGAHSSLMRDLVTDAHWHGNMELLGRLALATDEDIDALFT